MARPDLNYIERTDDDLEALAEITRQDVETADALHRQHAPKGDETILAADDANEEVLT